jgi:nucleoside-diphosphate-sugar epimerase
VYHVAAKAGSWGAYEDYHRINVRGTEHVLAACRQHGIRDLVYTSSPSVVVHTGDVEGVDETAPYPEHFEAHYPETKSRAERLVLAASCDALHTAALRPHFIWGPRDTSILPRLIQRSRAGQLRRIRGPKKLVDVTYIDDAATAHLLAMDSLRAGGTSARRVAGKAYFISSGLPIPLWEMIDHLLVAAGEPRITRSVSPRAAFLAGWVFEKLHAILRREDEPRMTRWVARVMTTAHWFDISAAKNDFGYSPSVSLDDGLARLAAWHRAQHG